jgi:hypothetical protein
MPVTASFRSSPPLRFVVSIDDDGDGDGEVFNDVGAGAVHGRRRWSSMDGMPSLTTLAKVAIPIIVVVSWGAAHHRVRPCRVWKENELEMGCGWCRLRGYVSVLVVATVERVRGRSGWMAAMWA